MSTNLRFSINFKFISNSTFEFQLNSNFISFAELKKKFLGGGDHFPKNDLDFLLEKRRIVEGKPTKEELKNLGILMIVTIFFFNTFKGVFLVICYILSNMSLCHKHQPLPTFSMTLVDCKVLIPPV